MHVPLNCWSEMKQTVPLRCLLSAWLQHQRKESLTSTWKVADIQGFVDICWYLPLHDDSSLNSFTWDSPLGRAGVGFTILGKKMHLYSLECALKSTEDSDVKLEKIRHRHSSKILEPQAWRGMTNTSLVSWILVVFWFSVSVKLIYLREYQTMMAYFVWWKHGYLFKWLIGLFLLFRGYLALVHRWDPAFCNLYIPIMFPMDGSNQLSRKSYS